jgi:hypothetical protein
MVSGKVINLLLVLIGVSGALYALYSVFIRTVRREITKSVKDNLSEINGRFSPNNANHR